VILLSGLPGILTASLESILPNATVALLVIAGVLLVTGTFLDLAPSLLIFTPILYPLALKLGVNPIQLGVVIVMVLAVGLFTPPVGQTLYISALLAETPIEDVSRNIFWFLSVIVFVVALTIFFPHATMFLAGL
jgi:TRAP-type C4-dicarboxylate transport system permease large subunit